MTKQSSAIPDYQTLMLPVLKLASKGELRVSEAVVQLADSLGLEEEARNLLLPSGGQTVFSNRVHWAKTYLVKAGLLEAQRRAHFSITPAGLRLLRENPERIDNRVLQQFESFRTFKERSREARNTEITDTATGAGPNPVVLPEQTPDEIMAAAHRQIEQTLAQDLLDRLRLGSPAFFEQVIIRLLLAMGYGGSVEQAGRALGRSGDDGVDGVIDQDALGLDRVYVQAKRYAVGNSVGSGAIRDFFGSLDRHKANKGLFVTTSAFSPSARETADYLSKRIVLIDGEQLARLMIRHDVGCRVERVLTVRKIDEDFFD